MVKVYVKEVSVFAVRRLIFYLFKAEIEIPSEKNNTLALPFCNPSNIKIQMHSGGQKVETTLLVNLIAKCSTLFGHHCTCKKRNIWNLKSSKVLFRQLEKEKRLIYFSLSDCNRCLWVLYCHSDKLRQYYGTQRPLNYGMNTLVILN